MAGIVALAILSSLLPSRAQADLHFLEPRADAGVVRSGMPLVHRFAFVNEGNEAVEITQVHAECGCLVPRLERRTFAPKDEGFLPLEVHTLSQAPGQHTWEVHVDYRRGGIEREATLELSAQIVAEILVEPAILMIQADGRVTHEIHLTDLRPKALVVTNVHVTSDHIIARLGDLKLDGGGHRTCTIRLELAADFPEGRHEETVSIYTDDPAYRELDVRVVVNKHCRQRLAASPREVMLQAAPGQPLPSRIVLIRDSAGKAVVIDQIVADDPSVTCKWAAGPGKMATVKIQVDRQKLMSEKLQTQVRIQVAEPVKDSVFVPITCIAPAK
jgi:hypothetical protein